jgi:hypothetical protein
MKADRQGEKLREGNVARMQNEALYKNVQGWETILVKRTISHAGGHGQAGAR